MRFQLRPLVGQIHRFVATVGSYGLSYGGARQTIMFRDIMLHDDDTQWEYCSDHVWVKETDALMRFNLKTGDAVMFDARVDTYASGNGINHGFRDFVRPQLFEEKDKYTRKVARALQREHSLTKKKERIHEKV